MCLHVYQMKYVRRLVFCCQRRTLQHLLCSLFHQKDTSFFISSSYCCYHSAFINIKCYKMSMMHRSSRLPPQCSSSKKTQQQKDQPSSSKNVWSSIARTESTKSFSTDSSLLSYGSSSFASSPSLASSFLFGNGRSSCGDIKSHLSTQSTYCSIIAPKDSHNISQAAVVTSSSSVISPASSSSLLLSSSSTNNNTIGSSVGGGNKIKPYRFRDEPQKKNIVKTELCSAILEGRPCKFGAKCNFAHHEGELRYQTIRERHNAGLIDGEIWRTRPCLNHIATGDW